MPYKQSKKADRKAGFFCRVQGCRLAGLRVPVKACRAADRLPPPSFCRPFPSVSFPLRLFHAGYVWEGLPRPSQESVSFTDGRTDCSRVYVGDCMVRNMFTFLYVPALICPFHDTCQECKKRHPVEEPGTPCVLTNARQHCNRRLITCQVTLVCNATKHLLLSIVYILDK